METGPHYWMAWVEEVGVADWVGASSAKQTSEVERNSDGTGTSKQWDGTSREGGCSRAEGNWLIVSEVN